MRKFVILACLTLASLFTLNVKANDVTGDNWVDAYGNPVVRIRTGGAAAVNSLLVTGGVTGTSCTVQPVGDANQNVDIKAVGTGAVRLLDGSGNVVFQAAAAVANAVNGIVFTSAITGANPSISPGGTGSDTNDSIILKGKGTGVPILQDGAGNSELTFVKTASAVDNVQITNGAAGSPGIVKVSGVGTDADIAMVLEGKGTGAVKLGQATASGIVNVGDAPIQDSASLNEISFVKTSTAVNNLQVTNAATGSGPSLIAVGTDTNIPITIAGTLTGAVKLGQATSVGVQLLADQPILDSSANKFLTFVKTSTAVDNVQITNAATAGHIVDLAAVGTDSNISMTLTSKGTGSVQLPVGGSTSYAGGVVVASQQFSIAGVGCTNGSTDDTLFTYDLPANSLKNNGDWVRVTAWGKAAGTTKNCVCKLFFGGTAYATTGTVSDTAAFPIRMQMTIMKTGSSTQLAFNDLITFGAGTSNIAPVVPTTAAITDTGAITIKFTGNCNTTSEILGHGFLVEFGHQ